MAGIRRGVRVRRVEEPPYTVDSSKLERYDQRRLIFNRVSMDPTWPGYMRSEEEAGLRNIAEGKPGYTRLDYALSEAAWTVHDAWADAFSWDRLTRPGGPSLMGDRWYSDRHPVGDVGEVTARVKRAAGFYGASLVGVTRVNPKWIYANDRYTLRPLELPAGVENAVVMAVEMDELGIATSPELPAAAATGLGYSRLAFTASTLAEFIRNLGYTAVPAANATGLSIPLAVDAGLGELGRNGLLITPRYGPRVRLCKVYTDLPLEPDTPIDLGVRAFCRTCKRCAEACEAEAISTADEPSYQPACTSSSAGALKWAVNSEKCFQYWCDNGADCSTCISVCPYGEGRAELHAHQFWAA